MRMISVPHCGMYADANLVRSHAALVKERQEVKEQLQAQLTKVTELYGEKDDLNKKSDYIYCKRWSSL